MGGKLGRNEEIRKCAVKLSSLVFRRPPPLPPYRPCLSYNLQQPCTPTSARLSDTMAGVVSLASMTLSFIKTLMVIDAVYGSSRGSRLVARAAGRSSTPPDARRPSTSSQTRHGPARAAASKAK